MHNPEEDEVQGRALVKNESLRTVTIIGCGPLRIFLILLVGLWALTGVVGLVENFVFHAPKANWYPLFISSMRLDDFTIYAERFRYFHKATFFVPWRTQPVDSSNFPFTYPAPAAIVFKLLFSAGAAGEYLLFTVFFVGSVFGLILLARAFTTRSLAPSSAATLMIATAIFSYPAIFAIDRGNIELINALLVWAAIACIWRRWWICGALVLGLAISFKLFPFFLLGLFVANRKYVATLLSIGTAAVATLLSYVVIGPTFAAARQGIASGLEFFQEQYVLSFHLSEAEFDHSLFLPVKLFALVAHHFVPAYAGQSLLPYARGYMLIVALAGLIFFFGKVIRLPLVNQIVILVTLSVLIPPLSSDYTLLHLYAAWAVLALCAVHYDSMIVPERGGIVLAMSFFAVLMSPEGFLHAHHFGASGLVKMLMLLSLVLTASIFPWDAGRRPNDKGLTA